MPAEAEPASRFRGWSSEASRGHRGEYAAFRVRHSHRYSTGNRAKRMCGPSQLGPWIVTPPLLPHLLQRVRCLAGGRFRFIVAGIGVKIPLPRSADNRRRANA